MTISKVMSDRKKFKFFERSSLSNLHRKSFETLQLSMGDYNFFRLFDLSDANDLIFCVIVFLFERLKLFVFFHSSIRAMPTN